MMQSKSDFLKIIITLTLFLGLTFQDCSNGKKIDPDKVEITFWHSFVNATIPALKDLLRRFETVHPGISVDAQYVPTGDALVQKLITAIQSGTAPDICWVHSDWLDKLAGANAIYPMERFVSGNDGLSAEELADFFPALLQSGSWRDTLYALPMEATTLALLYNRRLFREVGLDANHPPENWMELVQYAKRLTRDLNQDGKTDQFGFYVPVFPASGALSIWMVLQWSPFLWQAGGQIINAEQSQVRFNSNAGVQALSLWHQMYVELGLNRYSLSHDMGFASEVLAMVMDGPWNLPQYRKFTNLDWAIAPLPAGPAGRATYLAGEHLVIFKQSKHPDESWTFLKWVVQAEIQANFSISSGYLPVRRSTLTLPSYQAYLKTDPYLSGFVEQLAIARGRAPIDFHRVEINQNLAEAVEKAVLGNADAKMALDDAAAKCNTLLQNK